MKTFSRFLFFSALNGIVLLILFTSLYVKFTLRISKMPLHIGMLILCSAVLCVCMGLLMLWRLRGEEIATLQVRVRLVFATCIFSTGLSWIFIAASDLAHTLLGYRVF